MYLPMKFFLSKNELFTYHISDASFQALVNYLDTEAGKYIKMRLDAATQLDLASTLIRSLIADLCDAQVCTVAERDALLRMGEIKKSRAEELTEATGETARYLTLEDFE